MRAVMVDEAAVPQCAHDLDGLFEHLQPHTHIGPARTDDVLVERLARADSQRELATSKDGARRRSLRDDGRMLARRGAGDRGGDGQRADLLSAPIIDQTNGLSPCSSFHGWK